MLTSFVCPTSANSSHSKACFEGFFNGVERSLLRTTSIFAASLLSAYHVVAQCSSPSWHYRVFTCSRSFAGHGFGVFPLFVTVFGPLSRPVRGSSLITAKYTSPRLYLWTSSPQLRNSRIAKALFRLMLVISCLISNLTLSAQVNVKKFDTGSGTVTSWSNTRADSGLRPAIENVDTQYIFSRTRALSSAISKNYNPATIVEVEIPPRTSRIELNIYDSRSHEKFICEKGNAFWISPVDDNELKVLTVQNSDVARAGSEFRSSWPYAYPTDFRFIDSTVKNKGAWNYGTALQVLNYLHFEDILPPPLYQILEI